MQKLSAPTKVWLFLITVSIFIMMLGYHFGGRWGLFICFIVTVIFQALIFFYGDSPLLTFLKAYPVEGHDAWDLQSLLQQYAQLLQMQKPNLFITESPAAYAFSIGHQWQRGSICISTGLLNRLKKEEINAVLAHQICNLYRLNTFLFGISHIFAFALIGISRALDQAFKPMAKIQKKISQPFTYFFSQLAWLILKIANSDKHYYQNDEMAAALLKDRRHLAEALWKLEGLNHSYPLSLPPCNHHFFIVNPTALTEKNWFLLAHPKVDIRIKKLVGYYPI